MRQEVVIAGRSRVVDVVHRREGAILLSESRREACRLLMRAGPRLDLELDGIAHACLAAASGSEVFVHAFGRVWRLEVFDPGEREGGGDGADEALSVAPMPGAVVRLLASEGQSVRKGQPLMVIESMKLQTEICARRDGVVEQVFVGEGETFDRGARLVALAGD